MYDNIGVKIKGLAKFFFIVLAIIAAIAGLVIIAIDGALVAVGVLVILVGPVLAWASSWLLYGFGQLIENSDIIVAEYKKSKRNNTIPEKKEAIKEKANKEQRVQKARIETTVSQIPADGNYIDFKCPKCDEQLSFTQDELKSNVNLLCPYCGAEINTDTHI